MKLGAFILILFGFGLVDLISGQTKVASAHANKIRYAVIGDSYSNGEGASPADAWPTLLTQQLAASGLPVELIANPSMTGWTTQQAIDEELPVWKAAQPDFATIQIGVNDWVQGVTAAGFQKNLVYLLDEMLKILPDKNRLLVVTIPDFSVTPTGAMYGNGQNISQGIAGFNRIIQQESVRRGLKVVDVFSLSQKMRADPALVARDGLHPSAKEYALWEQIIYPQVHSLLVK